MPRELRKQVRAELRGERELKEILFSFLTANTFACARHVLESIKLGDETKKINTEAVILAKKARDNAAKEETWIAGSMSSMAPFGSSKEVAEGKKIEGN